MSDSPGRREVAHRVFAAEYDDATLEYSESDEERAPNYVVTPTGARVNRIFFVGVLTAVESVSDDVLRARIADPTGAFVVYAGQYQPEAVAAFESIESPEFVAVTGKARTFSPDDSDRVFSSVRPESVNVVDAETRDRWVVGAAEQTLVRAATFAAALELDARGDDLRSILADAGVGESLAAGIPVALDHYGTTEHYLSGMVDVAREALRLVTGEADEVEVPETDPDAPGDGVVDYRHLADGVPGAVVDFEAAAAPESTPDAAAVSGSGADSGAATDSGQAAGADSGPGSPSESTADGTGASDPDAGTTSTGTADDAGADATDVEPATDATDAGEATDATEATTVAAADAGDGEEIGDFGSDEGASDPDGGDVGDFEPGDGLSGDGSADDGTADETSAADGSPEEPPADDETATAGASADVGETEMPEDVLDDEERERIEEEYGTEFSTGTEVPEPGEADIEPEAGAIDPPEGSAEADDAAAAENSAAAAGPSGAAEPTEAAETAEPTESTERADRSGTADAGGIDDGASATGDEDVAPADGDEGATAGDEGATADGDGGSTVDGDDGSTVDGDDGSTVDGDGGSPAEADDEAGDPADVDLDEALLERMAELDDGDGADRDALMATLIEEYGVEVAAVEDAIQDALMDGKCYEPADGKLKPI